MTHPPLSTQCAIDRMVATGAGFALYRLPWTDDPVMVWQVTGELRPFRSACDLNGRRGFVMMPFQVTPQHPAVLIYPDRMAVGWEEIGRCVAADDMPVSPDGDDTGDTPTCVDEQAYYEVFKRFIGPLRCGTFRKLVLSRSMCRPLPDSFSPVAAFTRACDCYPRMMVTLCHTPRSGTWIGCSPEILLSGNRTGWKTVALAGTMPVVDEVIPDEWSGKNREEQAFVAAYIRDILHRRATAVSERGPFTARAGGVVHLKTEFDFCLPDASRLGDLVDELHPTPAVCGLPKQEAYDFILRNEGYDRQYYSGVIGWLDPSGDTHLYVNLRCMRVGRGNATLYAGGGILPSSVAGSEWEETREKMKTMRMVIGEGCVDVPM